MPPLSSHQSAKITKMLFIGDSGSGKTGALASLASAGYNIRIMDFDNGLDVLKNVLLDPNSKYDKGSVSRISYETLTDQMKPVSGRLIPVKATVWNRTQALLANWQESGEGGRNFGSITTWTPQDILVIDSLTMLANCVMDYVLMMNARLGQQPHQSDWGTGQVILEGLLKTLYAEQVNCNIIVNCHVKFYGEDGAQQRGYPESLGKALSPKIGRYFNSMLQAQTRGAGAGARRLILTRPTGLIELKNTNPGKVAPEYPLETGLADYFKAVQGE